MTIKGNFKGSRGVDKIFWTHIRPHHVLIRGMKGPYPLRFLVILLGARSMKWLPIPVFLLPGTIARGRNRGERHMIMTWFLLWFPVKVRRRGEKGTSVAIVNNNTNNINTIIISGGSSDGNSSSSGSRSDSTRRSSSLVVVVVVVVAAVQQ